MPEGPQPVQQMHVMNSLTCIVYPALILNRISDHQCRINIVTNVDLQHPTTEP